MGISHIYRVFLMFIRSLLVKETISIEAHKTNIVECKVTKVNDWFITIVGTVELHYLVTERKIFGKTISINKKLLKEMRTDFN